MKVGKLGTDKLQELVLNNIQYKHRDVLVHSGIGEDSAVVDFGQEVLVISSDPITGAVARAGFLAVHVTANDLAATGAQPVGMQVVLLVPESFGEEKIVSIMQEIHQTAAEMEIEIIGGHTEIVDTVSRPLIVITGIGKADRNCYLPTGGAKPGDDLIITKGVGIEGLYILASDYRNVLLERGISQESISEALNFAEKISVLPEGLLAARGGAHALHDITEGGLYGALMEMSSASGSGFTLEVDRVPVSTAAEEICGALNLDPLGLLSSGSMLIAAPRGEKIIELLSENNIEAGIIGQIIEEGQYIKIGEQVNEFNWPGRDELWKWLEKMES
ncbi:MAG: AIR synthase family protein [Halanaerobiaceae bacterium]